MSGAERELVLAAQDGGMEAFEELVRLYEKKVYALALRMCGNQEDAAEAAQEAFLSAWQGLKFFRGDSEFSTWLYRLTSNACIDLLRREKRQKGSLSLDDEALGLDVSDGGKDSPEAAVTQKELRQEIETGLATLSDEHRSVLVLREIHQLSYQEISDILQLDVGTVKSRISRGRRQLRKFLLERGNFLGAAPSNLTEREGCR